MEYCRGQRASADTSCVHPCLERLMRSSLRWLPTECHVAFWTLIVILIQSGRMPTHSGNRRQSSGKFRWASVRRRPFESDTRSIIGLEPAKRAVEKHSSCLLVVCERNVDFEETFTSGDCWSWASVAGDGTETISVQCTSRKIMNNPSVLRSLLSRSISIL